MCPKRNVSSGSVVDTVHHQVHFRENDQIPRHPEDMGGVVDINVLPASVLKMRVTFCPIPSSPSLSHLRLFSPSFAIMPVFKILIAVLGTLLFGVAIGTTIWKFQLYGSAWLFVRIRAPRMVRDLESNPREGAEDQAINLTAAGYPSTGPALLPTTTALCDPLEE